ncbi:recombinase family protein [uncultured Methanolobus sp.]|uniref:recombinase family protein n=1 Tax=uncultured Methanolobus sp. TaxID=218300 RepID=UPI0029C92F57|nr:recombinase family protein [uncultured Methanolobus sp.]
MSIKRVAIYIRTSTDKQKESPSIQREELQNYCKLKDYQLINEYVDFGWSGTDTDRPAFQNMLTDAKAGKFDILLVTKIDRFARSTIDLLTHVEMLKELNVSFATSSQPIDTTSSMGNLVLTIMGAFAEFERNIIIERTLAGRIKAEKAGKICHRQKKELPKRKVLDYLKKGLSCNAIAKLESVSPTTVKSNLNDWGYFYEYGEWKSNENCSRKETIKAHC